jgi:hypothetical protein
MRHSILCTNVKVGFPNVKGDENILNKIINSTKGEPVLTRRIPTMHRGMRNNNIEKQQRLDRKNQDHLCYLSPKH